MSNFERFSLTIARWLTHVYDEDNPAESSTNPGDVAHNDRADGLTPSASGAATSSNRASRIDASPADTVTYG